jgi:hypothetical protein
VALLNLICFELTGNWYAGLVSGLIYTVVPRVWEMAVITEVYNVNTCVFALALFLVVRLQRRPSTPLLCASAIVLGVSLGTYLANLLLLPGFVCLATRNGRNELLRGALFILLVVVTGGALLSWSHFRVDDCVPLGTLYLPDTLPNFVSFLMGSQYGTTMVHAPGFYLGRVVEHALVFGGSFAWLGVFLGLWGLMSQWKRHRRTCVGLLLMFLANMAFFTGYIPFDYYTMVTPCYFVFALWIAYCVDVPATHGRLARPIVISAILPLAVVAILLFQQLTTRAARSRQTPVTEFVMSSFRAMPAGAAVIADWLQFAPLVYFQEVHGFRQDLTLIERATQPRNYPLGMVLDWRSYLHAASAGRTVFVDEPDSYVPGCYKVRRADPNWHAFER